MCTCSLNFPFELEQNWLLNCLLDATPWIPNRYLQLNMFKTELSVFPLKPPPTLCTASVMASALPVVLAKPWDCLWFLSSHIAHPRHHKSLWAPPSKLVQKPTFPYLHFDHPGPHHHLFLNYVLIYILQVFCDVPWIYWYFLTGLPPFFLPLLILFSSGDHITTQASPCRASQNLPGVPELSQCKANVLSIALWCCVIRLPVSSRLSFQSFPAPLLQLCRPPCSSWNSSPGVPSMLLPHLLQALPEYHHLGETNIFVFPFSKYTLKITNFLFSFLALFFSIVKHNAIWFAIVVKSWLTVLQPHGLEPTRFHCPWGFLGKNTGVGCHFLL